MRAPSRRLDPERVFRAKLAWTVDTEFPWLRADYDGELIFLRINTAFPDEPMYSLLVDVDETLDFDDLPKRWTRGPLDWPRAE